MSLGSMLQNIDPRIMMGLGARLLSASGQGMGLGQGLGQSMMGALGDFNAITQQSANAERQKLQDQYMQGQIKAQQQQLGLEKQRADLADRMGLGQTAFCHPGV